MNRKGFAPFIIIGVIALLAIVGAGIWYFAAHNKVLAPASPGGVACTQEAKECPDGSYVGRTGPNCEFAACPSVASLTIDTSDWKTYTNQQYGFSFRYPADWGTPIESRGTISIGTTTPENYEGEKISITIIPQGSTTLSQAVAAENTYHGVAVSNIQTTTLAGIDARTFTENVEGGFINEHFFAARDGYLYEISYGNRSFGDPVPTSIAQVGALLSMFKFIQPTSTVIQ